MIVVPRMTIDEAAVGVKVAVLPVVAGRPEVRALASTFTDTAGLLSKSVPLNARFRITSGSLFRVLKNTAPVVVPDVAPDPPPDVAPYTMSIVPALPSVTPLTVIT